MCSTVSQHAGAQQVEQLGPADLQRIGRLRVAQRAGSTQHLAFVLGARQAGLGALNQQVALKFRHCANYRHGHFACRAGEINPA